MHAQGTLKSELDPAIFLFVFLFKIVSTKVCRVEERHFIYESVLFPRLLAN